MTDKEVGKALLKVAIEAPGSVPGPRLAAQVLARERWRLRLLAALTVLLWLAAAAGVFWVLYAAIFHLYPKQQQLMHDAALGEFPAAKVVEIQALHFQAVEICTRVVAASFVALTLAALCTVLLVLASRTATLRQINASLAEISEQLKQRQLPPAHQPPDPPGPAKGST
jgi:hypothetical protein